MAKRGNNKRKSFLQTLELTNGWIGMVICISVSIVASSVAELFSFLILYFPRIFEGKRRKRGLVARDIRAD
jgi:hypothetical protein